MPKAKLVTRSASTSSVTTDSIPKNAGLTNAELDSNFINLRDQGWRLRADDSTQHTITADTQINFSGGTITTDANGDITVSNLGGGGSIGDLAVTGSTISAPSNANLRLTASNGSVVVQEAKFMVSAPESQQAGNESQGEVMRIGYSSLTGIEIDVNHNGNLGGSFNIYGPDGQSSGYDDAPLQISLSGSHVGCIVNLAKYNSGSLPTGGEGYLIAIANSPGNSNRPAYYGGGQWRYVHDNSAV